MYTIIPGKLNGMKLISSNLSLLNKPIDIIRKLEEASQKLLEKERLNNKQTQLARKRR